MACPRKKIMAKGLKLSFFPISVIAVVFGSTLITAANAGSTNGADIYCFMRNGGNNHEPSWQAAYQFIKNKKQGLFKTSPKQAASFIVEAVVQDPVKYSDCINYLGDLYTGESTPLEIEEKLNTQEQPEENIENSDETPTKGGYTDRYNF